MKLLILHVPACPNVTMLTSRLACLLEGRDDVTVESQVIRDQDEAAAAGMTGSPTLLIDGTDPFPVRTPASLSCRLYIDEGGAVSGAPSAGQLAAALAGGNRA